MIQENVQSEAFFRCPVPRTPFPSLEATTVTSLGKKCVCVCVIETRFVLFPTLSL